MLIEYFSRLRTGGKRNETHRLLDSDYRDAAVAYDKRHHRAAGLGRPHPVMHCILRFSLPPICWTWSDHVQQMGGTLQGCSFSFLPYFGLTNRPGSCIMSVCVIFENPYAKTQNMLQPLLNRFFCIPIIFSIFFQLKIMLLIIYFVDFLFFTWYKQYYIIYAFLGG